MDDAKREFGRIYKRKGSRFLWVRYYSGNGRYREESTKSESEERAERLLALRWREKREGTLELSQTRKLTFADLEQRLLQEYEIAGRRSLPRLKQALAHLRETFGGKKVTAITDATLVSYRHRRGVQEGAAQATLNYELAVLRHALKLCRVLGAPTISTPAPDNARTRKFAEADFRLIVAGLPEDLRGLLVVAYFTGWRTHSELVRLTWDRVDWAEGWFYLESGQSKSGKPRGFPFATHPELRAVIEAQRTQQRAAGRVTAFVFDHNGAQISDKYLYRGWRRARKAAARAGAKGPLGAIRTEFLDARPHDFRRSAAVNLRKAGADEQAIMRLCGWTTSAMLRRYDVHDRTDDVAAVAALTAGHSTGQQPLKERAHAS